MFSLRLAAVCLLAPIGLGACSKKEPQFCNLASEFVQFESGIAAASFDVEAMEDFIKEWDERLEDMAKVASEEIVAEIVIMRAGIQQLDEDLDAVGYDLLELPLEQLSNQKLDEASLRFDFHLQDTCDISSDGAAVLVEPPDPLDEEEFKELTELDADRSAVEIELRADLEFQLGLTEEQSACFVEEVEFDELEELVSGDVSDETGIVLVEALETCGIGIDE